MDRTTGSGQWIENDGQMTRDSGRELEPIHWEKGQRTGNSGQGTCDRDEEETDDRKHGT